MLLAILYLVNKHIAHAPCSGLRNILDNGIILTDPEGMRLAGAHCICITICTINSVQILYIDKHIYS